MGVLVVFAGQLRSRCLRHCRHVAMSKVRWADAVRGRALRHKPQRSAPYPARATSIEFACRFHTLSYGHSQGCPSTLPPRYPGDFGHHDPGASRLQRCYVVAAEARWSKHAHRSGRVCIFQWWAAGEVRVCVPVVLGGVVLADRRHPDD